MSILFRPSSVVREQIKEVESLMPTGGPDDFATKLQRQAWQSQLKQLKKEYFFSLARESKGLTRVLCLAWGRFWNK